MYWYTNNVLQWYTILFKCINYIRYKTISDVWDPKNLTKKTRPYFEKEHLIKHKLGFNIKNNDHLRPPSYQNSNIKHRIFWFLNQEWSLGKIRQRNYNLIILNKDLCTIKSRIEAYQFSWDLIYLPPTQDIGLYLGMV